jgi:hypothetical protein
MFELKVNKVFKNNAGEDIYVISIKLSKDSYYNLNVTKSEIKNIYTRLKSTYENGLDN